MSATTSPPITGADSRRTLRAVALAGALLHLLGLAFALFALRPGTPAAPLLERLAYLARRPAAWVAGWLVWIVCAAALVAFVALLARVRPSSWTGWAVRLAAAGAVLDVVCDLVYALVLPGRAAGEVAAFLRLERALAVASLTGANGLYTIAILAATLGLPREWVLARALGFATSAGGLLLAIAGLTGDPGHALVGTALTIPPYLFWTLLVAVAATRRS
jgi:hypothetical protein